MTHTDSEDSTPSTPHRTLRQHANAIEQKWSSRRSMIGGVDNMWIQLEEMSTFNPCCAACNTFKGKMTKEMLVMANQKMVARFPKYGQRLSGLHRRFHGPVWEDVPGFNVADHVEVVTLPGKAGKAELEALMGELIARPWDHSRPLWETLLVKNYSDADGAESALLTRGHHTLTDGQGFVMSQLYSTSFRDQLIMAMDGEAKKTYAAKRGTARPSSLSKSLKPLDKAYESPVLHPFVVAFMFALYWALYLISGIPALWWSLYMAVHTGSLFFLTFWRAGKVTPPQLGARVPEREFATSKRFSMRDIKTIQKAFSGSNPQGVFGKSAGKSTFHHVTINDVMVSIMGDVLTSLIAKQKQHRSKTMQFLDRFLPNRISFFIPISIRAPGDWATRNLSTGGLVFVPQSSCSAGVPTPGQLYHHIAQTKQELNVLKKSALPGLMFRIMQLTGQAPILFPTALFGEAMPIKAVRNFTQWVTQFSMTSFQAILTNVPGPAKEPVTLEGLEILTWTALPPQGEKGTLGLGVISYAGNMCISVAADKVPGAEGVARDICEKFEDRFDVYLNVAQEVARD